MHQIRFWLGSAPDPAGGAYSTPPDPLPGGEGADIKTVATRRQILRLKCMKLDFDWGSAPDPAGELTALPETT